MSNGEWFLPNALFQSTVNHVAVLGRRSRPANFWRCRRLRLSCQPDNFKRWRSADSFEFHEFLRIFFPQEQTNCIQNSQTFFTPTENACAIYDQKNLGLLMFFIAATVKSLSFLFILAAWLFYRSNLKKYVDDIYNPSLFKFIIHNRPFHQPRIFSF